MLVETQWLGRFQLGDNLPLRMIATDSNGEIAWPTERGTIRIYNPAGTLLYSDIPYVIDPTRIGMLGANIRLDGTFSTYGLYTVWLQMEMDASAGGRVADAVWTFELLPGETDDGFIHSMYYWSRPEAAYVIGANDKGYVFQGRNPIV